MGYLALAFAVATTVTAIELITSKYPRTARFALSSIWFYMYVVIYGLMAAGALALLPLVTDQVTTSGVGDANPWINRVDALLAAEEERAEQAANALQIERNADALTAVRGVRPRNA